jgi:hypothetical protein
MMNFIYRKGGIVTAPVFALSSYGLSVVPSVGVWLLIAFATLLGSVAMGALASGLEGNDGQR